MYKNITKQLGIPPGYIYKILLIMRLTTVLLIATIMQVSAGSFAQKISLNEKNAPLEKIFDKIRLQSGYDFLFNRELLKTAKPVDINIKNADIEDALAICFKGQPFTYALEEKTIVIKAKEPSFLGRLAERWAAIDVHGRVVDQEGKPLPGATVKIKGTGKGVSTNAKGEFYLEKVDDRAVLVISFIGYVNKEVNAGREMGSIVLELSDSKLDELQVIAYGETTRRLSLGNVSTVKSEDIERQPVNNPLLTLQGRVPGVFIEQNKGVPGGGISIRIQGQNSIMGQNEPFYVIDGVPYTSRLLPGLNGFDTSDGNPLNYINTQDIASIDVLKDADATSIYGSRAANGAIIITTKRGISGNTAIRFNVQSGFSNVARKMKLLNTEEYIEMRKEAYRNDLTEIPNPEIPFDQKNPSNYDLTFWMQNRYTDWQKVLIGGKSPFTNIQGSISGGSSNTNFLLSANFFKEGTVTPSDLNDRKASVHFNMSNVSQNGKLKLTLSGSYLGDYNKLASVSSIAADAFYLPPNAPSLYNKDGRLNWELDKNGNSTFSNPLAALEKKYTNKTNNIISSAVVSYQALSTLRIESSFGFNKLQGEEVTINPIGFLSPNQQIITTRSSRFNTTNIQSWIIEPKLNYLKSIGRGEFNLLIGTTIQQEDRNRQLLNATGFTSDLLLRDIKSAASISVDGASDATITSHYKYHALFGRINYNWGDRYIVGINIRNDGSSRFGAKNKFHSFGSVAAAWLFTNETFVQNSIPLLSFGKIKASYGTSGNDQIGDYKYLNLYNTVPEIATAYQGIPSLQPQDGFPNPYLQWEETRKLSLALDLGFFKDRLLFNGTYYCNKSSNQLLVTQLPSITGGGNLLTNLPAVLRNNGVELSLSSVNISSHDFRWASSMNLSVPRNKLLKYEAYNSSIYISEGLIGKSVGIGKYYQFLGVDSETGLYQFADKNGNATSDPNPDSDRTQFIDLNPKFYGGLQNSLSFRGFALDILLQFVKQKGPNNYFGLYPGIAVNQPVSVLKRWQGIGDVVDIQKYNNNFSLFAQYGYATSSDKAYSDASYARLKNISLSWEMPEVIVSKLHLQNVKLFTQAQNLLTVTNYQGLDPENKTIYGIPPLRTVTFGIQVRL